MESNKPDSLFSELTVTPTIGNHLYEISRWARFLAILGIVIMACLLILIIGVGPKTLAPMFDEMFPGSGNISGTLFMAAIIFTLGIGAFLFYLLLRFALLTRKAVEMRNAALFKEGLRAFRTYVIIYAVIAIVSAIANFIRLFTI